MIRKLFPCKFSLGSGVRGLLVRCSVSNADIIPSSNQEQDVQLVLMMSQLGGFGDHPAKSGQIRGPVCSLENCLG